MDARLENLTPEKRALLERRLIERRTAAASRNAIAPRPVKSPVPLSYAQELLWLLSNVFYGGVAYNSPAAFRLKGKLDIEALRRALEGLVERHEILRTTYHMVRDEPMQVIADRAEVDLRLVDLVGRPEEEQEREVQRILHEESQAPFDLVNGPVLRSTVIRLSDDEHIFLSVLHHIATDGYSRAIFFGDLTALYEAAVRGEPSPLPPLTIQYADYAVWHRDWLERGSLDRQLAYWQDKLAGAPSRLDLPTDFARPPVRSYVGDHEQLGLDMPTLEGLRQIARDGDATLFVSLVALFATLLQRHAGQDDVVIGTPFAGRNRAELERMIGYFINPLALRIDLSGDPTFEQLLARSRETTMEAFANADVPYEMVVRATNPERDMSQTPVFQAMLVLHNPEWVSTRPTFEPQGIQASEVVHGKGWSKFDVLVGMSERKSGLSTTWEYSTELFERSTVRRMMEHFRNLAESAVASPDRPLSKLSMLSESERSQLLVSWNVPQEPLPQGESVKELFEAQARATPTACAVVHERESLTYAELNGRANRLAWLLRERGAAPGTLVGIMLEKSVDSVAAVLAAMKSGAGYVPIDPNYPDDRIEFMLGDAKPALLLTSSEVAASLPPHEAATVMIDSGELADMPDDDPPTSATGDDLAYVIYTSGSTGLPKGAMITNRSLASAYFSYERAYGLRSLRGHLQLASFSFDVFTGDIVRALLAGAKLVLCPLDVVVDPPLLYELMEREGVDAVEFVPATASLLFEYAAREGKRLDFMRLIAIGGEAWRTDRYTSFRRLCGPETRLINSYGLTEATMDSTWFEAEPGAELPAGRFVPIGRPFPNTRVYLLDANLEPVPVGIPGELCIGGPAVGRGYLNRPELTEERFVPDPFSDVPDARLYRTGDLARRRADGILEFVGRGDRQVKIRGFRVEPGEIEAVLERHAGVQSAAVAAREDDLGETKLVGYVVPVDPSAPPVADELFDFAAEHVPVYMIPSAWMVLEAPPLTPNGKIDVDALPDPEWERSAGTEYVAPRDETERRIAAVWSELLGIDEVGVTDNFFVLGGHSLLAVRLFAQLETQFGKKLPLTTLFRGATVEQLAAAIEEEAESARATPTIVPVREGGRRPPLFVIGGIDGEVIFYRDLVDALDPEQPVYGLQPEGFDSRAAPKTTIESIAADYVRDLVAFRPDGPYLLAGYCYSGYVAYEVARQLYERGTPASMLALIDTGPGLGRPTRVELERQKFQDFRERDLRGKAAWIRHRARGVRRKSRQKLRWTTADLLQHFGLPLPDALRDLREAGYRAWKRYHTRPAPIAMTLFRAVEAGRDWRRTALWSQVATGGVEVVPLESEGIRHDNLLFRPHVRTLAAGLEQLIVRAIARGDAPSPPEQGERSGQEPVPAQLSA